MKFDTSPSRYVGLLKTWGIPRVRFEDEQFVRKRLGVLEKLFWELIWIFFSPKVWVIFPRWIIRITKIVWVGFESEPLTSRFVGWWWWIINKACLGFSIQSCVSWGPLHISREEAIWFIWTRLRSIIRYHKVFHLIFKLNESTVQNASNVRDRSDQLTNEFTP